MAKASPTLKRAYLDGREASAKGEPILSTPMEYQLDGNLDEAWLDGYQDAEELSGAGLDQIAETAVEIGRAFVVDTDGVAYQEAYKVLPTSKVVYRVDAQGHVEHMRSDNPSSITWRKNSKKTKTTKLKKKLLR